MPEVPQTVAEGTPEPEPETVSIPKSELDKLQAAQADKNWARFQGRKLEEELKTLKAQYQELVASNEITEEGEVATAKGEIFSEMKKLHLQRQAAAEDITKAETMKLENEALKLARQYDIDAAELVGCKTTVEMENKALKLKLAAKPVSSKGIDTGVVGRGVVGRNDNDFWVEYGKPDSKLNRPEDHARARKIAKEQGLL